MRFILIFVALFCVLTFTIPLAVTVVLAPAAEPAVSAAREEPFAPPHDAPAEAPAQSAAPDSAAVSADAGPALCPSFVIRDASTGELHTLSRLDWIRGAVASEMPATWEPAALAAQAVAAHTWAAYRAAHPDASLGGADFEADPSHDCGYVTKERFFERYGDNAASAWAAICDAADFAANRLLVYEGEPALCVYHAMSSGKTEDAANVWQTAVPYLVPVDSEGDTVAEAYAASSTFGTAQMRTLLTLAFPAAELGDDPAQWIAVTDRSPSGYVTAVSVGGVAAHGQALREALGLRSSDFTLQYENGVFTLTTLGYGHGVGMSQTGAQYLAQNGSTAEEILLHYYPGCALVSVSLRPPAA